MATAAEKLSPYTGPGHLGREDEPQKARETAPFSLPETTTLGELEIMEFSLSDRRPLQTFEELASSNIYGDLMARITLGQTQKSMVLSLITLRGEQSKRGRTYYDAFPDADAFIGNPLSKSGLPAVAMLVDLNPTTMKVGRTTHQEVRYRWGPQGRGPAVREILNVKWHPGVTGLFDGKSVPLGTDQPTNEHFYFPQDVEKRHCDIVYQADGRFEVWNMVPELGAVRVEIGPTIEIASKDVRRELGRNVLTAVT